MIGITRPARPPVAADPELKRPPKASVHPRWKLATTREPTEIETLEVDRVPESVLADATPPTAGSPAIVGAPVDHPPWWPTVASDGQIDHDPLEAAEPLRERWVNPDIVPEGLPPPPNQGVGGAASHSLARLEETRGVVERMMVVRPTTEGRDIRSAVGRGAEREQQNERDEGEADHDVHWRRARKPNGSLGSKK